jgi:hypothetical protein
MCFTYIRIVFPVLQAHVQTNEDNLCEEVQTDEIKCKNKWTQKPVSFQTRNSSVDEVTLFSQVILVALIYLRMIPMLNFNTQITAVQLF